MPNLRSVGMVSIALAAVASSELCAQDYPSKPIRVIAPSAGGGGDFNARFIAQGLSGPLGQQLIVVNVGGGVAPAANAVKAPPDGYTVLVQGSNIWVTPFFQQKLPYGPKDLVPVSLMTRAPTLLVVHPSLPVKSVKELIALAKARPGELNAASGQVGSTGYVDVEFFKAMAGVNITRVAYTSNSVETAELLTGQMHMTFAGVRPMAPLIQSGKVRVLAVGSAQPSPLFPGTPTVAATVAGFYSEDTYGLFVPIKTPETIIRRLHQEAARYLSMADVKRRLLESQLEAVGSTPEEFAALIKSDVARLDKLINVDKVLTR